MDQAQVYCTLGEVIADMALAGDDGSVLERIRAASVTIEHDIGAFIPVSDTRVFHCRHHGSIEIGPMLNIIQVLVNGVATTDYRLFPSSAPWMHGPAILIKPNSGSWSGCEISITARWGKYEEVRYLMDAISLTLDAVEITVENGARLDTGMVMLIEDEQILVTAGAGAKGSPEPVSVTSLIDGEIDETDEVIRVDDGSEFHVGEILALDNEDLLIKRISGNDLVVARGWNDTLIDVHADNCAIRVYRTFAIQRGVNGTTAAAHEACEVSRYLVPDDVNYLCRQIAGLMIMKARSGWQGRTGNAETGQASYFSEFPPNQMEEVRKHYSIKVY
jgi:hypothetical protein